MKKYTATYFGKTKKIIQKHRKGSVVLLQFFQRKDNAILCGINEVLDFLKKHTDTTKYKIRYLKEGSKINNKDIVLELEGFYPYFGEYEGVIDGILARQTSIATNAHKVSTATKKKVIFMGDRADHYSNQERDGYAVSLGGIKTQVTKAQTKKHEGDAVGTVPHALIQIFKGDMIKALKAYKETFPKEKITALVDFNNDVVTDSLKALKEFKKELVAIRIDTAKNLSDKSFKTKKEYGVTPNLIKKVRKALDKENGRHVKIIISSGLDHDSIKRFEKAEAPVDIYGVGASLLKIENHFTADAVMIDGNKIAKVGRKYKVQKNLISFNK